MKYILLFFSLFLVVIGHSQVGIGNVITPHKNSSLHISMDNKGIILPRATDLHSIVTDKTMDGMMLYEPSSKMLVIYDGETDTWKRLDPTNATVQYGNSMLAFRVSDTAEQSITCMALVCGTVPTVDFGVHSTMGAYDPVNMYANGIVTIPTDGYYEVDLSVGLGSTASVSLGTSVTNTNLQFRTSSSVSTWKNIGSDQAGFSPLVGLGTWAIGEIKKVFYFNAGNQLKVSVIPTFTVSLGKSVIMNDSSRTYLKVTKTY